MVNLFMEDLEQKAIATAPDECKPKVWKRYVDDILAAVQKGKAEMLRLHLNEVDPTGNIKFTSETEMDGKILFLDTMLRREEDGSIQSRVAYTEKTLTQISI